MKDWVPSMLIMLVVLLACVAAEMETAKREKEDRALIEQLGENQKLTADILKLQEDLGK